MAPQSPNLMDNPLSHLVQQIDFAENEFTLFFAQIDSVEQRKQWIEILGNFLSSKGIHTVNITFSDPIQDLLSPIQQNLSDRDILTSLCIVISGLEDSIPPNKDHPPLFSHLNLARELFRRYIQHPIVIWLPEYALTKLARDAPDFWAWRSGVFDFNPAVPYLKIISTELDKLEKASKALETLSGILPSDQIEAIQTSFRDKQQKILAEIRGAGAIAQGEGAIAAAAGDSSIAIGRIHGDIYIGPTPQSRENSLNTYCRAIIKRTSSVALTSIDWAVSDPSVQNRLRLIDVYVDLDTRTFSETEDQNDVSRLDEPREREGTHQLSALEATINNRQLVLLGEPGSGKSTYLNFLSYCLATRFLNIKEIEGTNFSKWPEQDTLPILVTLREVSKFSPKKLDVKPNPQVIWNYITEELEAQNLPFVSEPLNQALEQGKTLVMLDGLDEVPRENLNFVRDAIIAFARRYPTNRYLVTSRTLSYSLDWPDLRLPWPTFQLASLDAQKIDQFVATWYATLGRLGIVRYEDAATQIRSLQDALRRPDLQQLAANPLLLTVIILINSSRGRLPESRSLLYEETADVLLWRWETAKTGETDRAELRHLLMKADRTDVDLKRLLWQLAFETQAQAAGGEYKESVGDISESKLLKSLAALKNNDFLWAREIAETVTLRSGLLVERAPGVYGFPNRNLQEYFAGAYLTAQSDFVTNCTKLLGQDWYLWREVVLLACERLVFLVGDTSRPLALVGELCPSTVGDDVSFWRNVWLSGDVLLKIGTKRSESYALGRELVFRVQHRLAELLTRGELSTIERVHAGDTLGKLGDPRPGVCYSTDDPLVEFAEIPAGPFIMGSQDQDEEAWDNEKPAHELVLPPYFIARYPVTVAQFRAFVEESGFQPADPESLNGIRNHPVTSVSWYDARAYCKWLTNKLSTSEATTELLGDVRRESLLVTLPSEAEWEKAARGGLQVPVTRDGLSLQMNALPTRIYPWGNEFDSSRANTSEAEIGNTTATGSFPEGASPYGLLDMAGNAWEWTRSSWGRAFQISDYSYPYDPSDGREDLEAPSEIYRILRGGSSYENYRFARTTFRMGVNPGLRKGTIGFRVVITPVF